MCKSGRLLESVRSSTQNGGWPPSAQRPGSCASLYPRREYRATQSRHTRSEVAQGPVYLSIYGPFDQARLLNVLRPGDLFQLVK
jgi:hypothetical protein